MTFSGLTKLTEKYILASSISYWHASAKKIQRDIDKLNINIGAHPASARI